MLKFLNRESEDELAKISNNLNSNNIICNQILKLLNNNKTNVKLDKNIKNSYYVFFNDTIYLSCSARNTNNYERVCVIAHECIHSVQSKAIQVINFILANIELISFALVFISMMFSLSSNILLRNYLIINLISMIPRLILEIDATIRSINLSEKYLKNNIEENESKTIIKAYKSKILLLLPLFIISLFIGRIIRFLFVYILMYIVK